MKILHLCKTHRSVEEDELWMLALYVKSEQEDLSVTDKKIVKRLIEKIKK